MCPFAARSSLSSPLPLELEVEVGGRPEDPGVVSFTNLGVARKLKFGFYVTLLIPAETLISY